MGMHHRSEKTVTMWVCAILCLIFMSATVVFDRIGNTVMVSMGDGMIPLATFNGVLNAGVAFFTISMVCIDFRKGYRISLVLVCCYIFNMLFSIIWAKRLAAVSGIANSLIMMVAVSILYRQLSLREKDIVTDFLTGLMKALENMIGQKCPFCLFYIDLDDFKFVNDNYGHKCGDQLLCMIASRMTETGGKDAVVSRLGGDEFVIVVPKCREVEALAQEIIDRIAEKVVVEDKNQICECFVTASVGIVHYPNDGIESETLIKYADIAMYQAKKKGKNKYLLFDKTMEKEILHRTELEKIIKNSLKNEWFYLVYQPQYAIAEGRIRGFEALLRLQTDDGNMVSPGEFIPVAEESDLILKIDEYVLWHAMQEFHGIISMGKKYKMSVNVSAKSICCYGFAGYVKQVLEETGFPAECLEIEITEYCIVQSLENAVENIRQLKALGVCMVLDDFGTGFASLSYLAKLSIDILKIDKSFVDDIEGNRASADFVNAVISIGHLQDCEVIAEGVENEMQIKLLKEYGCDYLQGYVWGRPMPYAEVLSNSK